MCKEVQVDQNNYSQTIYIVGYEMGRALTLGK
jgi:hypothetical protein